MKKNLFIGALAVFALTACSQDEVVNTNQYGNEIEFSVVANKGSRAANLWCNNAMFTEFVATAGLAKMDNEVYFENEIFTESSSKTWTTTNTHYWPTDANTLNIYATAGTTFPFTMTKTGARLGDTEEMRTYKVNETVALQEDVLYAATLQASNPGGIEKTPLNFRHALAQIVFQGRVTNPHLYVEVSEVRVANLTGSGKFDWSKDTKNLWEDHKENDELTNPTKENTSNTGNWELVGEPMVDGYTTAVNVDENGKGQKVEMTNADANSTAYNWTNAADAEHNKMAMLLVPQTTTAWSTENLTGSYIAVKCCMYHVADGTKVDFSTDVPVWATREVHEWVIIPAGFAWNPGKKYIYTINFGTGNGGFQPDPENPYPENPEPDPTDPKPVLTPITFDVTVDDFDLVMNQDTPAVGK